MRHPTRSVSVACVNKTDGLDPSIVRGAVLAVLDGEGIGAAEFSVTFLSSQRMRALNRSSFGHDRATDVISFSLPHPGLVVGDIYLCPSVARRAVPKLSVSEEEEMVRLVVHGTLHSLGYDHPSGVQRIQSKMWQIQEKYLSNIMRGVE